MTTTTNNEQKKLNVPNKREQNQSCLDSAEREGLRPNGNVPNLRFPEFRGEWEKVRLGEECNMLCGYAFNGEDIVEQGSYLLMRGINITEGSIRHSSELDRYYSGSIEKLDKYKLAIGDLVIGMDGSKVGRNSAIVSSYEDGSYLVQRVCRIRSSIGNNYILQFINNTKFHQYVDTVKTSSAIPHISLRDIKNYRISIPSTQDETDKIAKLFLLLDERIATQNKIIDKLQSLIKGINQSIFMNNNVINYKLGEVCGIRSGYSGNRLLSKKGLKVSRIETISGHKVNMERVGYVAPFESSENYRLRVGDILFSNINSVEYIGNTAFIDKDYDLYHGMNLLRLTPNNMVVIPFYLYLLLNTNRMLNRFKTICNKAVSQASINQTELGKTVVQIPDINAQEQICKFYQALYDKLESEKYANSLFQKQKQYLLRQMFI